LPNILNQLIGTKFKVITAANLRVALEGGTVEGICGMSYSTVTASAPEWISGNKLNFLAQTGLEKTPALPDVPMVKDFAQNNADRAVFQLLDYREIMGRPYVAPGGVPHDRLVALRQAFEQTMSDPDFPKLGRLIWTLSQRLTRESKPSSPMPTRCLQTL
jgi:tripartite-type tricarboxylate transporter receptor subunit TctC